MNHGAYELPIAILTMWPIHVIAAGFVAGFTALNVAKKELWRRIDALAFVVQWLIWFFVYVAFSKYGSLTTALASSILLGIFVGFGFNAFSKFAPRYNHEILRRNIFIVLIVCSVLVWALMPQLGE